MAQYRIVVVETIEGEEPPATLECADDREAITKAVDLPEDRHVEIWEASRLVIRLAPIPQRLSSET
jgi:hypothetical protein